MKKVTKIDIKYGLLSIIGLTIDLLLFFFTYDWVVDLLPTGFIGLLLFLVYVIFVFGIGVFYEFFLLSKYHNWLSKNRK